MLSTGDLNQIQTENSLIKGSPCEKLLGVNPLLRNVVKWSDTL